MKHHYRLFALSAILCLLLAGMIMAEVPRLISYQGKATDASGNAVPDGTYPARFSIYTASTGGTLLWGEFGASVTTAGGLFTYQLGTTNPIPDSLFAKYDSLFLGVMFNSQTLSPRTPLVSTGYAFRVNSVDGASGGTITGNLTVEGSGIGISCQIGDSLSTSGDQWGLRTEVKNSGLGLCYGVRSRAGHALKTDGHVYGVYGIAAISSDYWATSWAYGVYGAAIGYGSRAWAGYFQGNVTVNGTLSKSGGSFKIDHPLDPENKYLQHSFVESPDMMNVYNGNIILDANGEAAVALPEWFETLNRDFRYQLTAIGVPGPNLYIAQKVTGNQFTIAGGTAGMEVSWQVTGIRQDKWANANRIQIEIDKDAADRGTYLHPAAYGQPEEKGVDWKHREAARDKGATSDTEEE